MTGYDDRLGDYVDVAERIRLFREKYPDGSLQPANPAEPYRIVDMGEATFVVYVACAYRSPDDPRPGIGCAWEPFPGRTPYTKNSELMVAETSAWGRAIVACLAADSKKVASLDEVRARREAKTAGDTPRSPSEPRTGAGGASGAKPATDGQKRLLETMAGERGYTLPALETLTFADASDLITHLKTVPKAKKPAKPDYPDEEPF